MPVWEDKSRLHFAGLFPELTGVTSDMCAQQGARDRPRGYRRGRGTTRGNAETCYCERTWRQRQEPRGDPGKCHLRLRPGRCYRCDGRFRNTQAQASPAPSGLKRMRTAPPPAPLCPPLPPLPPHPDSGRGNWALLGPCRSRSRASAALQEIICFCMKMTEEGECCYFEICKLV